jgi:hypothetical protein
MIHSLAGCRRARLFLTRVQNAAPEISAFIPVLGMRCCATN